MIVIKDDVWRAECIAALGLDQDECELQVYPLNSADFVPYYYESKEALLQEYQLIINNWKLGLLAKR